MYSVYEVKTEVPSLILRRVKGPYSSVVHEYCTIFAWESVQRADEVPQV